MADQISFRRPVLQNNCWVFPPSGACIYCGTRNYDADEVGRSLADEHIIPLSLNGNILIPEASCKKCEGITSSFERTVSRTIFGSLRIHYGLKTRRKKRRPTRLPLKVYFGEGNDFEIMDAPVQVHPPFCYLPDAAPPRVLRSDPSGQRNVIGYFPQGFENVREHLGKIADHLGARQVQISATLRPDSLWLALAKIGHAFACAHLGRGEFHSFLDEIILRKQHKNLALYVGASSQTERHQSLHHLNIRLEKRGRQQLIVVEVSYFTRLNMLIYDVVVGRLFKDGTDSKSASRREF